MNTLCLEECIKGPIKFGNTWAIPGCGETKGRENKVRKIYYE